MRNHGKGFNDRWKGVEKTNRIKGFGLAWSEGTDHHRGIEDHRARDLTQEGQQTERALKTVSTYHEGGRR